MTADEQRLEFEKLCARAKRAGLLKAQYPGDGIAIMAIPPEPAPVPVVAASAAVPSP